MSVFFNGQLLTTPTTASAVDDSAMLNQNLSVGNVVAYVGISDAGEPQKVLSFGTPGEAKAVLKGGELCDAVVNAFAPSSQTGSPQTVLAVRVNKAGRAVVDLTGASVSTPGTWGRVYGKAYTSADQQIKVKIEAGTVANTFSVTVAGGSGVNAWSYTGEDLGASKLSAENLTTDTDILLLADPATGRRHGEVHLDIDSSSADTYTKIAFEFENFATLGDLTDYLEAIRNKANKPIVKFTYADSNVRDLAPEALDPITIEHAESPAASKTVALTMVAYEIQAWFENYVGDFVVLEMNNETHKGWHSGPAVMPFTYLQAPPPSQVVTTDWQDALQLLETKDVQWAQVVTGSPAIHAMVKSHVTVCSNVLRKERRTICGTVAKTSDSDAIQQAKNLNSDRVSLVHIGHYSYNAAGKLTLRPAYMTAALVAAGFAGLNPGTPLTNKTLAVQGLERDLRNPTDTDALIKGGVMPIENTENGYKVTRSISTWLSDSKYSKVEQSCGVAIDFAIRNVRKALDPIRGGKQTPIQLSRALSITKGQLTELARPEPMGPEVLVGDENSPAFRNITGTVEGDVIRIQFEASPVVPNNFILVTMYARPYSGSATV